MGSLFEKVYLTGIMPFYKLQEPLSLQTLKTSPIQEMREMDNSSGLKGKGPMAEGRLQRPHYREILRGGKGG